MYMQEGKEGYGSIEENIPVFSNRDISDLYNLETDDVKRNILLSINDEMNNLYKEIDDKSNEITDVSQERDQALREKDEAKRDLKEEIANNFTDSLTGCYNENFFKKKYRNKNAESFDPHRDRNKIALVYMDLDGVKSVNDTLGHKEGDKFIKMSASFFVSMFRRKDIIVRLHGDEFIAICRDDKGIDIAALEKRVNEIMKKALENDPPFSCSAGIAVCDDKVHRYIKNDVLVERMDLNLADTEIRADLKMYEIKMAKKNELMTRRKKIANKIISIVLGKK